MKQLTNLKGTEIWAMSLPISAQDIKLENEDGDCCIEYLFDNPEYDEHELDSIQEEIVGGTEIIEGKGSFQLLGCVTKEEVLFDCDELLGQYISFKYCKPKHMGYCEDYCQGSCYRDIDAKDELRSLLLSNGLYFDNPMPDTKGLNARLVKNFAQLHEQWKRYELNKLTGKLVILKLNK